MKKKRYLNQLLEVIRILRGSEIELAKKHLKAYETNHTINQRKMFELYKCIKIKEIHDYDKLKKIISPDSSTESFDRLIRRTSERIQESLIIDINLKRKNNHSEIPRVKLQLRKLLMQGKILMTRGLKDIPLKIFNKVINYGKVYELYDEIIEALSNSQVLVYNSKGLNAYLKVGEDIDFYEYCRNSYYKAQRVHREYEALVLSTSSKVEISKIQKHKIEELKIYYDKSKSANILSYYLLLKIELAKLEKRFFEVSNLINQLLDVLKGSKAIFSKNRISFLYNELSNISLNNFNFQNAIEELEYSSDFRSRKDLFYFSLKIKVLNIKFFLLEFDDVLQSINHLKSKALVLKFSILTSKLSYQKAIAHFGLKEFKLASKLLSQKNEIEKDKEGWNVWIRIMRLLCSIELLKLNMIDYDIESFRKYLQRIDKQYEVRERDKLVLKVLLELDRQDYDFLIVSHLRKKELDLLASTNKTYAWSSDSPELILFHEWFKAKLKNTEYTPNFEVYRKDLES